MNFLQARQGPAFYHIIKEHHEEFEHHIFDIYCETTGGTIGGLHAISTDIIPFTHPKFHFAGVWANHSDMPDYFLNETKGMTEEEITEFSVEGLEWLHEEYYLRDAYGDYIDDIEAVLEYHHICYISEFQNGLSPYPLRVIRNMPILSVW